MLEERLKQASKDSGNQWKNTLLLLVIGVLLGVVITLLLLWPSSQVLPPSHSSAPKVAQTTAELSDLLPVPSITASSKLRQQFISRLQHYQANLEREILDANLQAWNPPATELVTSLKASAVAAFSKAHYQVALANMAKLESSAREIIAQRAVQFTKAIDAVKQALNRDDVTAAQRYMTKALLLKPHDQHAQQLAKKVKDLPALMTLLKQVDVARIENNRSKELKWLSKAIKLAPARKALKQRRAFLAGQIKEDHFSALISAALLAVEKNRLKSARHNYKKAKALYPHRAALTILDEKITKRAAVLQLEQIKAEANKGISDDDWFKVQQLYHKAAQSYPQDRAIRDGLQLANKLVALQTAIDQYLKRSYRLADKNIFAEAQDTAIQGAILANHSPSMARKAQQLKDLLKQVNIKVAVALSSDNKTYILVKGVGKVGFTLSRTIQLKAGDYIFEGNRSGYQSKRLQVRIPIGSPTLHIEVICDAPI
ncbi:MAG: hypothetical protein Q9M31_03415 [Mariprofundus sp.]|nr:hypothetical protein [Mariprofundus sp.]